MKQLTMLTLVIPSPVKPAEVKVPAIKRQTLDSHVQAFLGIKAAEWFKTVGGCWEAPKEQA